MQSPSGAYERSLVGLYGSVRARLHGGAAPSVLQQALDRPAPPAIEREAAVDRLFLRLIAFVETQSEICADCDANVVVEVPCGARVFRRATTHALTKIICADVCRRHNVDVGSLRDYGRSQHFVGARHEVVYSLRAYAGLNWTACGHVLNRDLTTALNSAERYAAANGGVSADALRQTGARYVVRP